MYLKKTKRAGRVYLSVAKSYRAEGRVKTKVVESLGYVDELASSHGDPLAFAQARVEELNAQEREAARPVTFSIGRTAEIAPHQADAVQLGGAIALAYLDALGVGAHVPQARETLELLVASRMMHAVPLHDTWSARAKFPRACTQTYAQLFESLGTVAAQSGQLVRFLNRRYRELRGERRLNEVRLVLSNYVFRLTAGSDITGAHGSADSTPTADPLDGSTHERPAAGGEDAAASAAWGRLCLAIDGGGIPLGYRITGRDLGADEVTALVEDLKAEYGARRVTVVAAQVGDPNQLVERLVASGDGFVFLLPLEEAKPDLRQWAQLPDGYRLTRNRQYRIKSRLVAGEPTLKEIALARAGGEGPSFYIVSSELTHSYASIFNIYRELWRVHEPFQVITADFIAPPFALSVKEHLEAHFLICYTSFFVLRMLREDMNWSHNAAQVADALLNLEGAYLDEGWYVFNYRTEVTDAIERACGRTVGRRIMAKRDVKRAIARMRDVISSTCSYRATS